MLLACPGGTGLGSKSSQLERPPPPVQGEAHPPCTAEFAICDETIEHGFKFTKVVLGWEAVQLLDLAAIRTLVALGFLYELGVTLEWPEVQLLGRLGGWSPRKDHPPGETLLTRGLQRLLDHLATEAILRDELARRGALPPRIAALLGPAAPPLS